MDDQALVAAMLVRDPAGLDGAYRRYADRLYAYSRSVLRDADAAADVVQDTFLLASQRIGQLRDPDRLRPWLYTIARHECHRVLRARATVVPSPVPDAPGEDPAPEAGLAAAQVRELVVAAAASLSDSDREVIELAIRHDLSAPEVGAVMGVSGKHAHALLSRARSQLKRSLSALLLARGGGRHCAELAALLAGWDGRLDALLRKRIVRHADGCRACADQQLELLRPETLLPAYAALPFVAVADALRQRALPAGRPPSGPPPSGPPPSGPPPTGGPRTGGPGRRRAVLLAAAGIVVLLLLATAVLVRAAPPVSPAAESVDASASPSAEPLPTSLILPEPSGNLAAPTGAPTSGPTPSASTREPGRPDRSSLPPAPPVFGVTVESSSVSCQDTSYTLRVTVAATGGALATASLTWRPTVGSTPAVQAAMTRTGQHARAVVSSLRHPKLAWFVRAVASDGRTAQTPVDYSFNPCSSIGGITT